jgi:RND family efflux transporter MFP subunit
MIPKHRRVAIPARTPQPAFFGVHLMSRITHSIVLTLVFSFPVVARAATFDGFTEPNRKIDVAAAETGTVAKLLIHEGDRVTSGQPLATLDNDVLEVSREIAAAAVQSKGKLDSSTAERDLRKTRLERLELLNTQGHASQEEVDRARADLSVAQANLLAVNEQRHLDELERKKIEAMIERRTLRSPIDGIVSKIFKDEREFVSVNAAAVMTVVQLDPLRVTFSLPTAAAASLSIGQSLPLELAETGTKVQGKVEFIAPITEAESGTARVKVLVDNPQGQYRCGVRCLLNLEGKFESSSKSLAAGSAQN